MRSHITEFDTSCFSGEYVTSDVTRSYLDALERQRNDDAKARRILDDDGVARNVVLTSVGDEDTDSAVGM